MPLPSGEAELKTNFVSDKPSSWFSELYRRDGLAGGHVIMLGADDASKWVQWWRTRARWRHACKWHQLG